MSMAMLPPSVTWTVCARRLGYHWGMYLLTAAVTTLLRRHGQ